MTVILHRFGQICQIDKKSLQTSVVVIIVKNISHVLQAQIYIIITDALFLPAVAISQHFFKARIYQHKLIFGPSSLGVGHEICI